jgi:nucleoside-diphosphate-sugar epimerase
MVRNLAQEDLRVLVRDGDHFEDLFPDLDVDLIEGDISEQEDIDMAIDDVDTVFHCVNATLFNWGDLIGHTRRLITAAEEEMKVVDIVFPGSIHVYGDVGPGTVRENQTHKPSSRKGDIRMNLERQLREANARGECRTTIARLPDLYGPGVMSPGQQRIFPAVVKGALVRWPGDLDVEREFIYVDDAAAAMARLGESQVGWGTAWHVPGPRTTTAREFVGLACTMAGTEPRLKSISRGSLKRARSKDERQEAELFYLYKKPPILDGHKWRKTFGPYPATPYEKGLRSTVQWWREELDLDGLAGEREPKSI